MEKEQVCQVKRGSPPGKGYTTFSGRFKVYIYPWNVNFTGKTIGTRSPCGIEPDTLDQSDLLTVALSFISIKPEFLQ